MISPYVQRQIMTGCIPEDICNCLPCTSCPYGMVCLRVKCNVVRKTTDDLGLCALPIHGGQEIHVAIVSCNKYAHLSQLQSRRLYIFIFVTSMFMCTASAVTANVVIVATTIAR